MANKLTEKQTLFVKEYLVDLNATQAAIRAGYSENSAASQGYENLRKPEIAEAIENAFAERCERTDIDADYVLSCLKENVERSMQRVAVVDAKGNPTGEWTYQGAVANRALELIGKHLSLFTDRVEHTGELVFSTIPAPNPDEAEFPDTDDE